MYVFWRVEKDLDKEIFGKLLKTLKVTKISRSYLLGIKSFSKQFWFPPFESDSGYSNKETFCGPYIKYPTLKMSEVGFNLPFLS